MNQTFSGYVNLLFLNIFTYEANPDVSEFLKRYVPILHEKSQPSGGWAVYPPDTFKEPKHQIITSSYAFRQHPAFDSHRIGGHLSITHKVFAKTAFTNLSDIRLWLTFKKESRGKEIFDLINSRLNGLGNSIKATQENGMLRVVLSDSKSDKWYNRVQVLFGQDHFQKGLFCILISVGEG